MLVFLVMGIPAYSLPDATEWWMSKSDQYIWDWIPDLQIHGIAHGTWGCPKCGKAIFEGRGHYPWIWNPDRPYKVECPICKEVFPSNDYHKWMLEGRKEELDTTQPYVDDGDGYVGPDGTRYLFVKYAVGEGYKTCIWYWTLRRGVGALASKYADSGDEAYAHKCATIMARIATEYPLLNADRPDNLTQDQIKQLEYRRPPNGRLHTVGGYQVEAPYMRNVLQAYRRIYPYLEKGGDGELRRFLAAKGIDDVKSLIQWDLCHEMILGALEGNFVSGNGILGLHSVLALAAVDWEMHDPMKGATTKYILDWILHRGPNCVDEWLYNYFDRDGFSCTEGLGYNFGGGIAHVVPLAEVMRTAGVDLYALPRIREAISAPIKPTVAGKWAPSIGDGGSWQGSHTRGYWSPRHMGPPLMAYGDPLLAQAIANSSRDAGEYTEKVEEIVAKVGREMTWESRNYPIFGLGIFESGEGDYRRGVSCYYGGTTAHGHFDRLTFSVFNKRGPLTPELGYPYMSSPERFGWTNNTSSHNTVVVDARKQVNLEPANINMFTITPTAQALEVDGQVAYRGIVSKYNRTLIWVDVDDRNSYLVDIFRVAGGSQHDYSLHGAGNQVSVQGLELVAQKGGTLAGPEVEYLEYYDKRPQGSYYGSGYQYLFNVEKGKPEADFIATWDHDKEETPFLRVHVPGGVAEQVLFADGLPPFGKSQDALRYMFLRNGDCPPYNQQIKEDGSRAFPAGDLESTFVTVLEPVYDEPFINRVKRISGMEGLGDADVALAIERADGATDLLICLEHPSRVTGQGMTLEGRIGLCTKAEDGEASRVALLDGSSLSLGKSSIAVTGPTGGTVSSVDYDAMTLTVPEKLPEGDKLAGKTIIFNTPPRTTSFVISSVEDVEAGSRIRLRAVDAIAYRGKVERADNETAVVVLDSPISILHAGTGLAGMWLHNEDHSLSVRIESFNRRWDPNTPWPPFGGTARVEQGQDLEQAFVDKDGDGITIAYVYEFGPGDLYRITPTAYLEQKQ